MYAFKSKKDAVTLSGLAKAISGAPPNGTGITIGGSGAGINFSSWGMLCQTTTAIPARSGTTAGTADDVKIIFINNDGTMTDTGETMTVYNPFGSEVAAGTYITIKFCRGFWIVDAEDCP